MSNEYADLLRQLEGLAITSPVVSPWEATVCYVYDEAMLDHCGDEDHPERPDRVRTIHDHLTKAGVLNDPRVKRVESREATVEELRMAHTEGMIGRVLELSTVPEGEVEDALVEEKKLLFPFDNDTYVCHSTVRAAKLACGSVLSVVDEVMNPATACNRGFAAIRPPGHHACHDKSMGFCLFNNVAVAANYAIATHKLARVAVIDWDVHHGNGTADILHESSEVLFVSIHRYDRGKFYPGSGHLDDIGAGKGRGFNINVPIDGSYGDEELLFAWKHVVLTALENFKPELVLVSAGFDAAEHDPLGQCRVSCATYGVLTRSLIDTLHSTLPESQGRLILVLEGGYNLKSIAKASHSCMNALLDISHSNHISSPTLSPVLVSSPISSPVSSVRSVPSGLPKSSVRRMVSELAILLNSVEGGVHIPPILHVDDRLMHAVPELLLDGPSPLLLSGGGHLGAVQRYSETSIVKSTTVREALCYLLIAESVGRGVDVKTAHPGIEPATLVMEEKLRVDFKGQIESFRALSKHVSVCTHVVFRSFTEAEIVLDDLTCGLAVDATLGVLDIKLGTEYHTPDDLPDRVLTRRQKATATSASTLGMRVTACRCVDGFSVGKKKAAKLKLIEQMVPVVRRFLYSSMETFEESVETARMFVETILDEFGSKKIKLKFIASSFLFVLGKDLVTRKPVLRCKMIDLAHLFPADTKPDGFTLGCQNLIQLLDDAKHPSYESA